MQSFFKSPETTDNKDSKNPAARTFFCLGQDFDLLYPYPDHIRKTHAGLESTGENLLRLSFPKGVIQLFTSLESARVARGLVFHDSVLRGVLIPPNNEQYEILSADTYFEIIVDDRNNLKNAHKKAQTEKNGRLIDYNTPCFETSIDHVSEIVSVRYDFRDSEYVLHDVTLNLSQLSKEYLQGKKATMKQQLK
jgi:hypothetical protein